MEHLKDIIWAERLQYAREGRGYCVYPQFCRLSKEQHELLDFQKNLYGMRLFTEGQEDELEVRPEDTMEIGTG